MSDRLQLALLAKMADDWHDQSDAMVTVMLAMVLRALNADTADMPIDLPSTQALMEDYILDREYYTGDSGARLRVTITKRMKEVTSDDRTETGDVVATPERHDVPGDPDIERTG